MRRALTPLPRRGSENSSSSNSAENSLTEDQNHLFIQRLGQDVSHTFAESAASATQRCSLMQVVMCVFQILKLLLTKSKACRSKDCQCHAGEDSVRSECSVRQSRKESGESKKEPIAITSESSKTVSRSSSTCVLCLGLRLLLLICFLLTLLSSSRSSLSQASDSSAAFSNEKSGDSVLSK